MFSFGHIIPASGSAFSAQSGGAAQPAVPACAAGFPAAFRGSAVGWIWGVIQPLVLLASWTFVFSVCLKQKMPRAR